MCAWVPPDFRKAGTWTCYDGLTAVGPAGFRDNLHPSPRGNSVLADRIASLLKAHPIASHGPAGS